MEMNNSFLKKLGKQMFSDVSTQWIFIPSNIQSYMELTN